MGRGSPQRGAEWVALEEAPQGPGKGGTLTGRRGVLLERCGAGRLYRGGHDGTKGRGQCLPSGLELRSSSLAEAEGVRSEGDVMGGSKEGSGGVDTGEEEGTRSGTAPEETLVGPTPGREERRWVRGNWGVASDARRGNAARGGWDLRRGGAGRWV